MEYLCKIIHSTSHSYNRSTRSITKNWYFYKNDILYHLSYHEYQYTILDRVSKQNIISTSKKFYVHVANDKSCYEKIDDIEEVNTSNAYIVISKNGGIVYKRINRNNRVKNKVTLVSDNPQYEPYQVNTEDIIEVWKAQMIITKANIQQRWDVNQLAGMVNTLQEQVTSLKKKMN